MWKDPIVQEVRKIREANAKKFNYKSLLQKHIKPHCVYYILHRSMGYDILYSNYLSIGVVSARGSQYKEYSCRCSKEAKSF